MSVFYKADIFYCRNFAPEKSEMGTALRATFPIFRARSATLFCTRKSLKSQDTMVEIKRKWRK